jgi:bifunctional DNA-binding transcriptional regulator/antitoxin component of YhaV-PrlF toxin-antitoxin module
MVLKRKLTANGNGCSLTLPKTLTDLYNIKVGDLVEIKDTKTGLLILYPDRKEKN